MRSSRIAAAVLAAIALVSVLEAPAQASEPEHSTLQVQGDGAVAVYTLPSGTGSWYVNFGSGSYVVNGERFDNRSTVAAGIFESTCTADGSCSGYGVDGIIAVPAGAFTIDADLGTAVLPPTALTAQGWACTSGTDADGQWQSECHEITISTTVSASLVATGSADVTPYHQVQRDGGDGDFAYRSIISDVTMSRPAAATASAFDLTSSDPSWARIARQSSTNISTSWSAPSG